MGIFIDDRFAFLPRNGRQAQAIRAFDWSSTSLGRIDEWSATLRVTVGLMLASGFPKCIAWGPELITIYNDAFLPILGDKFEALGRPFSEVWHEAWPQIGPIAERALTGTATFVEDFPLVVDRSGGPEQAYFTFSYSPIRDEHGRVVGIMDTVIETTKRIQAERQAQVLNEELAHRISNLMAVIGAVADRTLRSSETLTEARTTLSERLRSMGKAHAILAKAQRNDALVEDVLVETLTVHVELERITWHGPPLRLNEQQALALALAVNELATNAIKYGALSVPQGTVRCHWQLRDGNGGSEFVFMWREEGGPPVSQPKRRGFGSYLIEQHVGTAFQGSALLDFSELGLAYDIVAPIQHSNDKT
ncbi:HWE histidine kinase domain-containing protein (plasmid) [Novosphingobium sp. BL-8A]|uniref:HWE histidine kinase domain-containing protein n=1 Tax=Novosphingobium sp. BL-8A TaxID=3127639 RepID=UPI0037572325